MRSIIDDKTNMLPLFRERFYVLLRKIGIDRTVLLAILTKLWSIIAAPLTILVVVYKFSPQLQGYYYTFFSVLGFQFLVELGLSNIIIQFASHEWSRLSLDNAGKIVGEGDALSRLQSVAQLFFRWYYFASIVLTLGLMICGYLIFSRSHDGNINWMLPWFSLCVCNGVIFCLIPIWALLEGCNQILKLYSFRFIQGLFLSISLWISVLLGAKLWVVAISYVVSIICAGVFLLYKSKLFLKTLLFSVPAGSRINWRQDILPLQWRTTIASLISAFTFGLFVPVLFAYHGSVIAGQMGMTLSIVCAVTAMSSAWLYPKVPQFGMLIAKKKYKELDELFWRTTRFFLVISILGATVVWFIVYSLNEIKHPLALRFLPLLPTGLLLLAQVVLNMSVPFQAYLRAHKKEPFLYVSVVSGIYIGLSTLILGKYYSVTLMAMSYLLVMLILLPVVLAIWYYCRKEWHKDEHVNCEVI